MNLVTFSHQSSLLSISGLSQTKWLWRFTKRDQQNWVNNIPIMLIVGYNFENKYICFAMCCFALMKQFDRVTNAHVNFAQDVFHNP